MVKFITDYSKGKVSSNLITVTVANPNTYEMAAKEPERFELVRVRMGGWTEYFAAMFPEHQKQHERRPFLFHRKRNNYIRFPFHNLNKRDCL